jgi:RNA polymerase sigma-70 factor (ECF subfamily)
MAAFAPFDRMAIRVAGRSPVASLPMSGSPERDAAFERWVVPHLETLYRVGLAITGNHAEAEDLVQDSLIRAYRGLDGFDGANPRGWLLTILRNTHLNRHRRRRPGLLADPDSIDRYAAAGPGADDEALTAVFDARVEQALATLPAPQRTVIELVDVDGLSYREAAEVLDVAVGTVMSRLHRGRRRIRRRLGEVGLPGRGLEREEGT